MNKKSLLGIALSMFAAAAAGVEPGAPAPGCTVAARGGEHAVRIAEETGRVLLVDFWASWCAPCKHSFPFLNELHRELKDRGLEVIAVNVDENRQDAERFLERTPVDFRIGLDPEGVCPARYEVQVMPSSFLIDREGRVRRVHLGFRQGDQTELRAAVETLLGEP